MEGGGERLGLLLSGFGEERREGRVTGGRLRRVGLGRDVSRVDLPLPLPLSIFFPSLTLNLTFPDPFQSLDLHLPPLPHSHLSHEHPPSTIFHRRHSTSLLLLLFRQRLSLSPPTPPIRRSPSSRSSSLSTSTDRSSSRYLRALGRRWTPYDRERYRFRS